MSEEKAKRVLVWDALLAAILAYAVVKRHDLVRPMITRRKALPANAQTPFTRGPARALLALACSVAATIALIRLV